MGLQSLQQNRGYFIEFHMVISQPLVISQNHRIVWVGTDPEGSQMPSQECKEMKEVSDGLEQLFQNAAQAREMQLSLGRQTLIHSLNIYPDLTFSDSFGSWDDCSYILKEDMHVRSWTWWWLLHCDHTVLKSQKKAHLTCHHEELTLSGRAAWGWRTAHKRHLNVKYI